MTEVVDLRVARRARAHALGNLGILSRFAVTPDAMVEMTVNVRGRDETFLLTIEDARDHMRELAQTVFAAERLARRLRGADRWVAQTYADRPELRYMRHADREALFVRTKVRRSHRCASCKETYAVGAVMYRQAERRPHWVAGPDARICVSCAGPDP